MRLGSLRDWILSNISVEGVRVGFGDGPVEVALARAQDTVPPTSALPGGCVYEWKWDGYRLVVVRHSGGVRLWSRRGTDLTPRFPDIAAAAEDQLPAGTVLDGEVVIWNGRRLDFDLLSRRLVTTPATARAEARAHPASYAAFDLLDHNGRDQRDRPWRERRTVLEDLAQTWRPPLQLSPVTEDVDEAREWLTDYRPVGIEGLVVKGVASRYGPGRRDWIKVKSRKTTEAILGGVLGTLERPEVLIVGQYQADQLLITGRSTALSPAQAASLTGILTAAGPGHPWPELIGAGPFRGAASKVPLLRVEPTVVVEVSADSALHGHAFRHAVRYVRHRPDLQPEDLPTLPA